MLVLCLFLGCVANTQNAHQSYGLLRLLMLSGHINKSTTRVNTTTTNYCCADLHGATFKQPNKTTTGPLNKSLDNGQNV